MKRSILLIFLSFTYMTSFCQNVESNKLFKQGVEFYNQQRYEEAISKFKRCLEKDNLEMDSLDVRKEYSKEWIAHCYYKLNSISNAISLGVQDYELKPIDRTLTIESDSIFALANIIASNGNAFYAITKMNEGIKSIHNNSNIQKKYIADAHALLASLYANEGVRDFDNAINEILYAKKIYTENDMCNTYAYALVLLREAYIRYMQQDGLSYMELAKESLNKLLSFKNARYSDLIDVYNLLAIGESYLGLTDKSKEYIILLAEHLKNIKENEIYNYSDPIITCCQGLIAHKYYDEAFFLLNKSIEFATHHSVPNGNDTFFISLLYTRSDLFLNCNRLDESLNDVNQLITICENTMFFDRNQLDEIYVLLANVYWRKNQPIQQLNAARTAYELACKRTGENRTLVKANAKSFMAGANNVLENKKEAIIDVEETIKLYAQANLLDTPFYASALSLRSDIEKDYDPQIAIDDLNKSISIHLKQPIINYSNVVNAKISLYNIYKRLGIEDSNILQEIEAITQDSTISSSEKEDILLTYYKFKGDYESISNPNLALNYYYKSKKISNNHKGTDTVSIDQNIATCLARMNRMTEATAIIDSLLLKLKEQNEKSLQYDSALGTASLIYALKGDVINMKKFQSETLELFKGIYGSESVSYAGYLTAAASQLIESGLYLEALPLCKEAEKKMLLHFTDNDPEIISLYSCLQKSEFATGDVNKAIMYGEKARLIASKYSHLKMLLIDILGNLSNCYREKCQFNEAMDLLNQAMSIAEETNGRFNRNCAMIFLSMANVSQQMGNYSEARSYNDCFVTVTKQIADESQPEYALATMHEAAKLYSEGKKDEADSLKTKAKLILYNTYGVNHPITLEILTQFNQMSINQGDYSDAILNLEYYNYLQTKINKFSSLSIMSQLATLYGLTGRYKDQIKISNKCLDVVKSKYGRESYQEGNVYVHLANAYMGLRNNKKGAEYSHKAFNICRNMVLDNFMFMTKDERTNLWNSVSNYFIVTLPTICASDINSNEFSELTYNAALLSKGLLLKAETNIADKIYNSGSENIKSQYINFLETKELYNKAIMNYPIDADIDEKFSSVSVIDSLEKQLSITEHTLMKNLKAEFGDYTSDLSTVWTDVRNVLKKSDIAIEFQMATYGPDSLKYYALVIEKNSTMPTYIELFSNKDIEKYHNFKFLTTNEMQIFAESVWKPIISKFPEATNIYFSPIGELYNLPIESLPVTENGVTTTKDYKFYRLSSTRELVINYNDWKQNTISIYGNIKYDASSEEIIENDKKYNKRSSYITELPDDIENRASITLAPLPGTEEEIYSIKDLINSTGRISLQTETYIGTEASEASIKSLSGKGQRILHIATHGFYLHENKVANSKYLQNIFSIGNVKNEIIINFSPEDAALLRCGLYMAGAKNRLNGKKTTEMDDGILNAKEISMLDFKGLDLAVLSACETGIGDISGDGVFGLQRGFKKAGTHSILMSLWKVDDDATAYLMKEFYNSWLSGKSKQESLEYAKKKVRENSKWSTTKFWSAFVLLDAIN